MRTNKNYIYCLFSQIFLRYKLLIILFFCALSPCLAKENAYNFLQKLLLEASGVDFQEQNAYMNFNSFEYMRLNFDPGKVYVSDGKKGLKMQDNFANEFTKKYIKIMDVGNDDNVILICPTKYSSFYDLFINYSLQGRVIQDISNSIIKIKFYIPEELTNIQTKSIGINFRLWDKSWKYYDLGSDFSKDILLSDIETHWCILVIDFQALKLNIGNVSKNVNVNKALLKNSTAFSITFKNPRLEKTQQNIPIIIDWIDITNLK